MQDGRNDVKEIEKNKTKNLPFAKAVIFTLVGNEPRSYINGDFIE